MARTLQIFLILSGIIIFALLSCKKYDCGEPCKRMVECPAKMSGKTVTDKEMDLLVRGCEHSCGKHSELMWKCYEKSKNSGDFCKAMFECGQLNFEM